MWTIIYGKNSEQTAPKVSTEKNTKTNHRFGLHILENIISQFSKLEMCWIYKLVMIKTCFRSYISRKYGE